MIIVTKPSESLCSVLLDMNLSHTSQKRNQYIACNQFFMYVKTLYMSQGFRVCPTVVRGGFW